jgi:hypothetical protein
VCDHALGSSTVDRLVSIIFPGNVPSERVAHRLSMTRRASAYVLGDRPVSVYELRHPAGLSRPDARKG